MKSNSKRETERWRGRRKRLQSRWSRPFAMPKTKSGVRRTFVSAFRNALHTLRSSLWVSWNAPRPERDSGTTDGTETNTVYGRRNTFDNDNMTYVHQVPVNIYILRNQRHWCTWPDRTFRYTHARTLLFILNCCAVGTGRAAHGNHDDSTFLTYARPFPRDANSFFFFFWSKVSARHSLYWRFRALLYGKHVFPNSVFRRDYSFENVRGGTRRDVVVYETRRSSEITRSQNAFLTWLYTYMYIVVIVCIRWNRFRDLA